MTALGSRLSALSDARLRVFGVVGFTAALAAASQVAIPIPGTPVPFTLQPMIVVLAGLMLGPTMGAASMVLYVALGAAGLPVFSPLGAPGFLRLVGPTGGYLIAFPVAAYVAGFVAARRPGLRWRWAGAMLGMVAIFIGGITQLTILTGSVASAVALGVTPFAVLDIGKAFLAGLIAQPRFAPRSIRD